MSDATGISKYPANYIVLKSLTMLLSFSFIDNRHLTLRLPWWLSGVESACSAGDKGSIPG